MVRLKAFEADADDAFATHAVEAELTALRGATLRSRVDDIKTPINSAAVPNARRLATTLATCRTAFGRCLSFFRVMTRASLGGVASGAAWPTGWIDTGVAFQAPPAVWPLIQLEFRPLDGKPRWLPSRSTVSSFASRVSGWKITRLLMH